MASGVLMLSALIATGPMTAPLASAALPTPDAQALAMVAAAAVGQGQAWAEPEISAAAVVGVAVPEHDGQWFERIHVVPRLAALGYLTADLDVEVEVWNAWRHGRSLVGISISGPAGVGIPADTLPQAFAALQSRVHLVPVSLVGEDQIANVVTWEFSGISDAGADLTLTGWRLLVFGFRHAGDLSERYGYLSSLWQAWDGSEQRASLRSRPDREIGIATLIEPADLRLGLMSQIFAVGRYPVGLPLWMDATPPTASVLAGATVVPVATPGRAFAAGGLVLLWRSSSEWEVHEIETLDAGSITLTAPAGQDWPTVGTSVMPILPARFTADASLGHPRAGLARLEATFSVEPESSLAPAATGVAGETTYEGFDVLTETRHNAREAVAESFGRLGVIVQSPTGKRLFDDRGETAYPVRNFLWTAADRTSCVALREFLDRRLGRVVPFWTPTFIWDLELAEDTDGAAPTIVIRRAGYGQFLFNSLARRRLAIFPGGGTMLLRRVLSLEDGENTETLTLDVAPGVPLAAASSRICFLVLCRLEEDLTEIIWGCPGRANAAIRFREVPHEVPA